MEKDQNIEAAEAQDDETNNELMATYQQKDNNQPVVVKKSGGGLALLLSLVALALSGYLFYKDWLTTGDTARQQRASELLAYMKSEGGFISKQTNKQHKQQIDELTQSIFQVATDLENLRKNNDKNATKELPDSKFDNSNNEAAIERLQTRLTNQAQIIESLKSKLAELPTNPIAQQPQQAAMLQKSMALQALMTAQSLIDNGHIDVAAASLENYLLVNSLSAEQEYGFKNLIERIRQTEQPDLNGLRKELQQVEQAIDRLKIKTQQAKTTEPKWYDRFVSVKKISADNETETTLDLLELKVDLHNHLRAANAFLNLQIQQGWQDALSQAALLLQQKMATESVLIDQIKQLSQKTISPQVDENLGIMDLINNIKGAL